MAIYHFLLNYLRGNETCGACERGDTAVVILEVVLPRNETGHGPEAVVRRRDGRLVRRRRIQRRHPVMAR